MNLENIEPWAPEAAAFYRKRGLSHSTVTRFKLGRVRRGPYAGRLGIPYIDGQERVRGHRYRALDDRKPKILGPAGQKTHLFAVRATDEEVGVIVEGEMDAMSCWQAGVKAVGLPGANVWQNEWALLFRNCVEVVVALHNDEAGEKGAYQVVRSLTKLGLDVRKVSLPPGRDLNDLLVQEGPGAIKETLGVES